jgi:hypothetical protein
LKPGDPGFVYDKRIDFSKGPKVDDGWDESDDGNDNEDVDDYFDDDF